MVSQNLLIRTWAWIFFTTQGLPSEVLDTTWSASCLDILIEWIGFELHILLISLRRDVSSAWATAWLFEPICKRKLAMLLTRRNNSSMGRYHLSYALLRAWSLYLPGRPSSRNSTRDATSKIFEEVSSGIASTNSDLLHILRRVMTAPAPSKDGSGSFPPHSAPPLRALAQSLGVPCCSIAAA